MIVISNTSPLYYLTLIECVELLPTLFGQVYIPESVKHELSAEGASETVRYWIASPPAWLRIVPVAETPDISLAGLHRGEQDAILLGKQRSADLIILDEKAARYAAVKQGLAVTGLIGILDRAAATKLIDLSPGCRPPHANKFPNSAPPFKAAFRKTSYFVRLIHITAHAETSP